jgi:L-ascorbate metabolism protein UlaG (beta-lactamase superfamily)
MLGGPFLNYDPKKVDDIRKLIEKMTREQAQMLELAEGIKALDEMLAAEATGHSLEAHYRRVPDFLKGYVELTYDLNHNPSIRFIESLLYHSKYYRLASQSLLLSHNRGDSRSFAFSTPRLCGNDHLHLNLPFIHPGLDELFKMKFRAQPYGQICEMLSISPEQEELFLSFFTEEQPEIKARYTGDAVRIRYLGHACVLIESKDVSILCDPIISYQEDGGIYRYTYADLPEKIDYVLITHSHQDHVVFETLLQLRHKIKNLIVPKNGGMSRLDPSLKLMLQTIGFAGVREVDEMEAIEIADGHIMGLPFLGEHADLGIRTKLAYCINLCGNVLLFAADSNNLESRLYAHLQELIGDIDILFLGMECDGAPMSWLYGPLLTKPLVRKDDQSRRFDGSDCEKGMAIIDILQPKEVYIYAMGQEPWCTFLTSIQYTDESRPIVESNKLIDTCQSRGIIAERLYGQKETFLPPR